MCWLFKKNRFFKHYKGGPYQKTTVLNGIHVVMSSVLFLYH